MKFTSTRNDSLALTAAEAIVKGLSDEGGLFVPTSFPKLEVTELVGKDYLTVAETVLSKFLPSFGNLRELIEAAYEGNLPVALQQVGDLELLELFHGKTSAFKDVALQLLPYLLTESLKQVGETRKAVILTATSGDTGSAAMSGFSDVAQTEVFVFYPSEGISELQRLQMTTQAAKNVHAIAIRGNFDDAQRAVKALFQNKPFTGQFSDKVIFSSANSINLGRLLPQVVYYFWTYAQLLEQGKIKAGDKVNFSVPTGNFGNILAGFYAKQMGLPVGKLICATNKNRVLADFFETGKYDANRDFYVTNSPSMDILVSSNLERLLYHYFGSERVSELEKNLAETGKFELTAGELDRLNETFISGIADDAATLATIKAVAEKTGEVLDPHTAIAYAVGEEVAGGDLTVALATASAYKFPDTVKAAIGRDLDDTDMPKRLAALATAPVTQDLTIDKTALESTIEGFLK